MGLVRVATYNVHGCRGVDGRTDPARTAAVIAELRADVVGLQEVDSRPGSASESRQAAYLAQASGYRAVPGPTILREDRSYGNVLLTRLPVLAVHRFDLTVPGREPRGAVDADLDTGDAVLRVVVTHLGLRASERAAQLDALLAALGPGARWPEVLLGDLNEWWPFSPRLKRLQRAFPCRASVPSFPARCPILALDRLCARPRAALIQTAVHRSPLARTASDHRPVWGLVDPAVPWTAAHIGWAGARRA